MHPDLGSKSDTKLYLNKLLNILVKNIAYNVHLLVPTDNKNKIINYKTIESAIKLCFPDELLKHSMSEGLKAVAKYTAYLELN